MQHRQQRVQLRRGTPCQLAAHCRLVVAVGIGALQVDVAAEAIAPVALRRQAPAGAAVGAPVAGHDAQRRGAVVPGCGLAAEFEGAAGITAAHADEPGECVGSIDRAARAAQYLDVIQIEQRRGHADTGKIDIVDQEADRWIRSSLVLFGLANAAQLEIAWPRGPRGPAQPGHQSEHVFEMLHACRLQRAAIKHRRALRQLLQRRAAQAGADHHLLERRAVRRRGGRPRRRATECHKHGPRDRSAAGLQ